MVMALAFSSVIGKLSSEYARRYAVSAAEALSAHINKEIGLMSKAARSDAVIQWVADEQDEIKKTLAYEEMVSVVGELYSYNLYIGLEDSLHEYKIDESRTSDLFQRVAFLDENDPKYDWFFECVASDKDYLINVGFDDVTQRKCVWLDYVVKYEGEPIGVICTGLEFSHLAWELFSQFESDDSRGLVIDGSGGVHIDSTLMNNNEFLYSDYDTRLVDEFSDQKLLSDVSEYLDAANGNSALADEPVVFRLSGESYTHMTIMPIRYTDWSVVILSGAISRYNISLFIPVSVAVLVLLLTFTLAVVTVNSRLIFMPIGKLSRSLPQLQKSLIAEIYGVDRDDELGELSRTIRDLFTKANVDALTGIYNRRYIENNLAQTMEFLSRSNSLLSVLMMDIDFFKRYNDTYGHDKGDLCLKAVAMALSRGVSRANDFVARYGGEEFLAVLPNTDETGARAIAEKLLDNVRDLEISHTGNEASPNVTVSIGVASGTVSFTQRQDEFLKRADEALYMSKQNGRNRYTYLDLELSDEEPGIKN
jgi:diguanylate cyclase (GGDEF)-like protein